MRNRSFALDGDYVSERPVRHAVRANLTWLDRVQIGWGYWCVMVAALIGGALWRAYAPGARAPGLTIMVFVLMNFAFYVFVVFPLGAACGVASVKWARQRGIAALWLALCALSCGAIAAVICSLGRMRPEWGVLALYGGIAAAFSVQTFSMARRAWLSDHA
jgi:hypothetical protein